MPWLGREGEEGCRKAAKYLPSKQLPCGGRGLYPGSAIDVTVSAKAHFALKPTAHDPQTEQMERACRAIRQAGGADRVNSFTRFYLALLGQIGYEQCPAVPPEMILLPRWFPFHLYRMSAWSRTIFVPLSIVWAHQPTTM